jgi:hypothetical protein
LNPWVHSVILGAEAEFGEKPPDQKPVVGFSPVSAGRAPGFSGQESEQVDGRDRHVQVEVKLLLASGLAVGETGMLLCIPDHKLNLVAQAVVPNDLFGALIGVGRSEYGLFLPAK